MQLALGTAQFGLAYGIAGRGEAVPDRDIRKILELAVEHGVRLLDTATGYGDIEAELPTLAAGLPFQVISKIPALADDLSPQQAAKAALQSAKVSRKRLGSMLIGLMAHRASDLAGERGQAVWEALQPWARGEGVQLGVSCYGPEECLALKEVVGIEIAQIPGNAFDQRLESASDEVGIRSTEIHLRSAFLQGLLLMPEDEACRRLPAAAPHLRRWHAHCIERRMTPLECALAIVKSFDAVQAVVVGVDDLHQWKQILQTWKRVEPEPAPDLASQSMEVIDPRLWSTVP